MPIFSVVASGLRPGRVDCFEASMIGFRGDLDFFRRNPDNTAILPDDDGIAGAFVVEECVAHGGAAGGFEDVFVLQYRVDVNLFL